MEDLTLALITLTSFVLLFVVAIFADRAGLDGDDAAQPVRIVTDDTAPRSVGIDAADVA
jgi:cation transporter-like permease